MIKNLSKKLAQYDKGNKNIKIAIVGSNYHRYLTKSLEETCKKQLIASGVKEKNIQVFEVPGSWEIPIVAKNIAISKKFDGIAAFGVIIKGDTYHFEMIANECSKALMEISLEFNISIALEVLATYNLAQAKKRSTGKYNKGIEAANTLLKMIRILSETKKL
ncbi:6,7-dimethyl-8-ribityllumazine synthase [Patescibacteria group bacterium]|nr:6,7-dimethyl-8-ribityllumazine synthase [Patescibacteria group bacterium]